jgi:hypothetical protein
MSAVFNHIESEKCEERALQEDIRELTREFLQNNKPGVPRNMTANSRLFRCWSCGRGYQRLSDLLQHSETRSCRDGYWRGTGNTGHLVQYVRANLKKTIDDRLAIDLPMEEKSDRPEAAVRPSKILAPKL